MKKKNAKQAQKRAQEKRHKRSIRPNKGAARNTALGVKRTEVRKALGRG